MKDTELTLLFYGKQEAEFNWSPKLQGNTFQLLTEYLKADGRKIFLINKIHSHNGNKLKHQLKIIGWQEGTEKTQSLPMGRREQDHWSEIFHS